VKDEVVSSDKLHVYTFGSPRVGNKDFAYGYDRVSVASEYHNIKLLY